MQLYSRSSGQGLPVILLHAFPLSSAMWLAQREALSSSCRVITPDLRGFGGSQLGDDPPSVDAMADDVAALLDAEGIERAVVGGQSMGGYVTMAFCRRHPSRVLGVILADTKASADTPEMAENREKSALSVLDGASLVDTVPTLLGETTLSSRGMVVGRVRELVRVAPPKAVAWAQRAMAARPASFDTLSSLEVPALVVVGEEDKVTPRAESEAMAEAAPRSHLVVIENAGHLSAIEAPQSFNQAVTSFLRTLP